MIRIILLIALILLARTLMYGQLYASSSASTSVDIIVPVGAESKGEIIAGTFYPGTQPGTVELNNNGIIVSGGINVKEATDKLSIPSFHIVGGQYSYSITFSYDPWLFNRNAGKETMLIESFSILPVNETGQTVSERFSIGAKLQVGPSQVPGIYSSATPCAVTFHFN